MCVPVAVELLILAHDCFSLTCNMEGIVKVLQAARHLSHTHLAHGERYGLLVRKFPYSDCSIAVFIFCDFYTFFQITN